MGDLGSLVGPNGSLTITDAQLAAGYVLHVGELEGSFAVGDEVTCKVDYGRRAQIAPNHTFTHVLNYALRWVLVSQPPSPPPPTSGPARTGSCPAHTPGDPPPCTLTSHQRGTSPFASSNAGHAPGAVSSSNNTNLRQETQTSLTACSHPRHVHGMPRPSSHAATPASAASTMSVVRDQRLPQALRAQRAGRDRPPRAWSTPPQGPPSTAAPLARTRVRRLPPAEAAASRVLPHAACGQGGSRWGPASPQRSDARWFSPPGGTPERWVSRRSGTRATREASELTVTARSTRRGRPPQCGHRSVSARQPLALCSCQQPHTQGPLSRCRQI